MENSGKKFFMRNPSAVDPWLRKVLRQSHQELSGEQPTCDFSHIFTRGRDETLEQQPSGGMSPGRLQHIKDSIHEVQKEKPGELSPGWALAYGAELVAEVDRLRARLSEVEVDVEFWRAECADLDDMAQKVYDFNLVSFDAQESYKARERMAVRYAAGYPARRIKWVQTKIAEHENKGD